MRPGVDNAEELIAAEVRLVVGHEVMGVALIKPDAPSPGEALVVQRRDDAAGPSVDDHRRSRRLAAEQDLILRADCHSHWPGAFVDGEVEGVFDQGGPRNHYIRPDPEHRPG